MAEKTRSSKREKTSLHVTGMTCASCATTIEKGLARLPGVAEAYVWLRRRLSYNTTRPE